MKSIRGNGLLIRAVSPAPNPREQITNIREFVFMSHICRSALFRVVAIRSLTFLLFLVCALTARADFTPTSAFTDNGDGTVTHQLTGLTWMRCSLGQTWTGSTCTGTASAYTFREVKTLTHSFADHIDWRLPDPWELSTIVDYDNLYPAINAEVFPNTPNSFFWSGLQKASDSYYESYVNVSAWYVHFDFGVTDYSSGYLVSHVRFVRGTDIGSLATPTSDFTDNGDGTVTHKKTNLIWKRCPEGQTWTGADCSGTASTYSYDQAVALTSSFAGKSDWRMPNIQELQSIIEYGDSGDMVNQTIFPTTSWRAGFWSGSPYGNSSSYAWYGSFGKAMYVPRSERNNVRLVRGGQSSAPATTPFSSFSLSPATLTSGATATATIVPNTGATLPACVASNPSLVSIAGDKITLTGSVTQNTPITITCGSVLVTLTVNAAATPTSEQENNCLFNWAERKYPDYFSPAGMLTKALSPYSYRYYSKTNTYLGTAANPAQLYYVGPLSQNTLLDVGTASSWVVTAGCSGVTGNSVIANTTVKPSVLALDETNSSRITIQATSTGADEITLPGDVAGVGSVTVGSPILLPPGQDSRYPLGIAGIVETITTDASGQKKAILKPATLADVMTESQSTGEITLNADNFIGVIAAPSLLNATQPRLMTRSGIDPRSIVVMNGALVIGPGSNTSDAPANRSSFLDDSGDLNLDDISFDDEYKLADFVDDIQRLKPYGSSSEAKVKVFFKLSKLKLVQHHDFNILREEPLKSMEMRLEGNIDAEVKLVGGTEAELGYFSNAWNQVDDETIKMLGFSAKLSGLDSKDKFGKFPIIGVVFSTKCPPPPSGCPVVFGTTQTPLRQAEQGGVILWVNLILKGLLKLDGELGSRTTARFSIGMQKPEGQELEQIFDLSRPSTASGNVIEIPFIKGNIESSLRVGYSIDVDTFIQGIRLGNAALDVVGEVGVSGNINGAYAMSDFGQDFNWTGTGCLDGYYGGGYIASMGVNLGVKIDTKFTEKPLTGNPFNYERRWPTDEEIKQPGWHGIPIGPYGTWYSAPTGRMGWPSAASCVKQDGACGSANGTTVSSAPSTNLCASGIANAVSGTGPWLWSCIGVSGGANASCSANKLAAATNGICGSANGTTGFPTSNFCESGTLGSISDDGGLWSWTCAGGNGGTNASCFSFKTPTCGSSHGTSVSSAPSANLCSSGTASSVAGTGPWSWSCTSSDGKTTASCTANKPATATNGACGSANGTTVSSVPTANLCSSGTAGSVSGSGPWSWSCAGSNGGTTASCTANKQSVSGGQIGDTTFTDNGDGTVTDRLTGLTWMRCAMGQTWMGSTCSATASTYTWDQAKVLTSSFAGKSDWRLPTPWELVSIVDYGITKNGPAINSTVFPGTSKYYFWSGALLANYSDYAWSMNFYGGQANKGSNRNYEFLVRLVRGGQSIATLTTPTSDFTDNGDGTVTHKRTGLTWKRCAEGQAWTGSTCSGTASTHTYDQAQALTPSFAGKSDWRIPNIQELQSIVEYGVSDAAINAVIFPATPSAFFWSGSPYAQAFAYSSSDAWAVEFYYGAGSYYDRSFDHHVRLVRGTQSAP